MTERVQAKLGDIETQPADAGKVSVPGGLIGADDVRAVWEGLDVDRRRAVIDALMRITLHSTQQELLTVYSHSTRAADLRL